MLKKIIFSVICLAVLFVFSSFVMATGQLYFSANPINPEGELPFDAVYVQQVNDDYCLFLPGAFNSESLYVCCTDTETVEIEDKPFLPDEPVAMLKPGQNVKIKIDGKSRIVHVYQGSQIHAVFLDSSSGSFSHINKSKQNLEAGSALIMSPDGIAEYQGGVESIRLRGNSTTSYSKKNYNIKLDSKANIAGMGKAKKWVLVSSVKDHSLLRNQIIFDMARYVGLPFSLDLVPCDVWLNHVYNGEYILTEKIEIGSNRIEINDLKKETEKVNDAELDTYPQAGAQKLKYGEAKYYAIPNDPDDITGGYILEYENYQKRYEDDPSAYTTERGKVIVVKEPKEISKAQAEYIGSFIQGYENAIFAKDGIDPVSGKHYYEFMDFESLVLKYMLEEIAKNEDGNASSQYYFKPSDKESTVGFAGPAWDYDVTFGGFAPKDKTTLLNPKGFYQNRNSSSQYWWPQLCAKSEFADAVIMMWNERYSPAIKILLGEANDPQGRLRSIDEYASEIIESANMNFVRWPIHYTDENVARTGRSFEANIDYLKDFIQKRFGFLEENWQ